MSEATKGKGSYGTILKSSSIIGGSQAFSYCIGLARTKCVALLLGPSGVGLVGIYHSIMTLVGTVSGMGLVNSGVREISAARAEKDQEQIGQLQLALRRLAFILGGIAFILLLLVSPWISDVLFQSRAHTWAIGLLGLTLIFNGLKGSQTATIQGFRKIGDLAKATMFGTVASTVVALSLYAWLGERGIVPALLMISAVAMLLYWRFAKRLYVMPEDASWRASWGHSKRLLTLGAALAWGALLGELIPFVARAMVVRELGVEANGYYVAAWAISGLFVNFIISAMCADYFPRLSAVASDLEARNQLINEQTEIGIIAALPGVLAMTTLAPIVIQILYSAKFTPAADLLPWFLLGLLGRVIAWPMGMLVLARGEAKVQAIMQTISVSIHLLLMYVLFNTLSLTGLAMAFACQYLWYNAASALFLWYRYEFRWNPAVRRMLLVVLLFLLLVALLKLLLPLLWYAIGAAIAIVTASVYSVFQLYLRVASHPKLERVIAKLPRWLKQVLDRMVLHYG